MATPYPPHVRHGDQAASPQEALSIIQQYLSNSESKPWLHPDALLSERGPQFAGTISGGLTMHNLRRVEAGLRGERMVPTVTDTDDAGLFEGDVDALVETISPYPTVAQAPEKMDKNSRRQRTQTKQNAGLPKSSEWEDMDNYRRHQDIVQGEMGQRDTGVADTSEAATVPKIVAPDEQDGTEKKYDDDNDGGGGVETSAEKAKRRKEREDRKREKRLRREAREERRREKRSKRESKSREEWP